MFITVALKTTFNNSLLTYESEIENLYVGQQVEVPLQKRTVEGTVIELNALSDNTHNIKKIIGPIEDAFHFLPKEIELLKWTANYYHYPLGLLIHEVKPKYLKRPRKLEKIIGKNKPFEFTLSTEQKTVITSLIPKLNSFHQTLIHGITGSGKTAIYLELIKHVLQQKKSALFLLPEINLTPQFLNTLQCYLNCPIYSYHSAISNSEKFALWKLAQENSNEPFVVLGVRSSIFVPINNLGLIIVDEEHDNSFKQEERCPYNARDLAIKKAHLYNIPVIMGSATPSFETYYRQKEKTDGYFYLANRIGTSVPPKIELFNSCEQEYLYQDKECWPLLPATLEQIDHKLKKNEQVLIFVNRLGHANYLMCHSCGHQFHCPNCSTTLRMFKNKKILSCNICDYQQPIAEICPECSNMHLVPKGYGTEYIENLLKKIFPQHTTKRLDRDEITTMRALKNRLEEFHEQQVDILVGTQMVSKGHNFEKVNLVVILGIDGQLNYPDFKANERVFQLIKQVAGRSGRFTNKSEVIIQTYSPHNPLFNYIMENNCHKFYTNELQIREQAQTPPYQKLAVIYIGHSSQHAVITEAQKITHFLHTVNQQHQLNTTILGPRPALVEKKKNEYSWTILLKNEYVSPLHILLNTLQENIKLDRRTTVRFDIDPYCIY